MALRRSPHPSATSPGRRRAEDQPTTGKGGIFQRSESERYRLRAMEERAGVALCVHLHEAMEDILRGQGWLSLEEVARRNAAQGLWRRPTDSSFPDARQLRRRAVQSQGRHLDRFEVEGAKFACVSQVLREPAGLRPGGPMLLGTLVALRSAGDRAIRRASGVPIRRALSRSGGFDPQRRSCTQGCHGELLEEAIPDARRRTDRHAGDPMASPWTRGSVAYGNPSLLGMPGLASHVEEAERNTALGTPAAA